MKKRFFAVMMSILLVLGLCACGKSKSDDSSSGSKNKEDTRPADEERELPEINGKYSLMFKSIDRESADVVSYYVYRDYSDDSKINVQKMTGTVKGIEDSYSPSQVYDDLVVWASIDEARCQEYANYFNANIAKHFPANSTSYVNHIESKPMYNDYQQLFIEICYYNEDGTVQESGTVLDCYKTPAWVDGLIKMFESETYK